MLIFRLGLAALRNSWFRLWVRLELNIISFIPIFTARGSLFQLENRVKYFLTQAVASLWFFFSSTLALLFVERGVNTFIILAIIIKLGLAPCHTWFFRVMLSSRWIRIFLLSTIQKFIPLLILRRINAPIWALLLSLAFSTMVVVSGGIKQLSARKVLTFSSLNNIRWMVASTTVRGHVWGVYFIRYMTIVGPLIIILSLTNRRFTRMIRMSRATRQDIILILSLLFSLGGLPPLLGFFNKLVVGKLLLRAASWVMLFLVVASSLVLLFFYTTLAFYVVRGGPSYQKVTKGSISVAIKAVRIMPLSIIFLLGGLAGF